MLSLIAAIGKNNELGKEQKLLWIMPADMKHFREITTGHPVIMGRKTFESIGRALPNRRNIVITRDTSYAKDGIEIVHSLEEALELCHTSGEGEPEVFIIGGGELYKQGIEKADKLYITRVNCATPDADTYFPQIEENIWQEISKEDHPADEKNPFDYSFVEYMRK